jgi:hypothetical protein
MLLRVHRIRFRGEKPFILFVAEEETLDKVTENINVVRFLNQMEGVEAALTSPEQVEKRGDDLIYRGHKVTVIFLDINNDVLLKIATTHNCYVSNSLISLCPI